MSESRSLVSRAVTSLAMIVLGAGVGAGAFWWARPLGPDVATVTPPRARPGDVVTLKGSRFGTQGVIVLFGDQTGPVVSAGAGEIRATVPPRILEGSGERHVAVRLLVGDRASPPVDLTVYGEVAQAQPPASPDEVVTTAVTASSETAPPTTAPARPATRATALPPIAPKAVAAPPAQAPALPARATPAPTPRPIAVAQARPQPRPPTPATLPAAPPAATPTRAVEATKPAAPPAPPAHTFVLERSAAVSNKRSGATLAGFDAIGVDLKRGPEVPGRVEFEITPDSVKAGDRYTVTAFLINDGSKPVHIKEMFVATTRNGVLSAAPVAPRNRDVSPRQRQVIGVFSDVWQADVVAWAMDVSVTSDRGDVYKNQVTWR